jgi:hypothetical protein
MAGMHGDNGLLQVMTSLVWWGEVVAKREEEDWEQWRAAVTDVTWVLEQLLAYGEQADHVPKEALKFTQGCWQRPREGGHGGQGSGG